METLPVGQPLIQFIKLCYQAEQPVLLIGRHGTGKSEVIQQAARDLRIDFISRDLSLMEPPDLVGLPHIQDQRTVYYPPAFLPTAGRGLLVIEELNRADRYMRGPCLQLLTARTLNDYHLPPGWLPAAVINPPDGSYEVDDLDPALMSRFAKVQVQPSPSEWLKWAHGNAIHPKVAEYVESDDTIFEAADSHPRAWVAVSKILTTAERERSPLKSLRAAIFGLIGAKRASAFCKLLSRPEKPLTPGEILDDYPKWQPKVSSWIADGRVDALKQSFLGLLKSLQPDAAYRSARESKSHWQNLHKFFKDLPGDLQEEARNWFEGHDREFPLGTLKKRGRPRTKGKK